MCTIQYIDGYKNVIADAFSRVFINPEVLPTLSDFIPSKIDSPEPPASTTINASISASTHSANSPLHPPPAPTPIVMSAASTTRSMAKKAEGTLRRPLLEIPIPKWQATGSPLAIAVSASPVIPDSPILASTPAPQFAVQTIEQLVKADLERYQTKKMQLPRHDRSNEASVEAAGWRAQHAMMHWTACDDPMCVIHRSSHEYRKSFKDWNHCQYCNYNGHYTGSCPVKLHDDTYTECPKLPPQRLHPGVPGWVLQIESLPNSSDVSVSLPATTPQSTTPPVAPMLPLDLDYDSSASSETMNSAPPSPVTKLAPRPRSPGPNYSSDPETLPSYSPVLEAREYAFRPRIVYNDGANETTEELTFKSFNSANPDMESRHIPIDGKGNKSWEYLRAVAKDDLKDIGEFLGFVDISYPELVPELQHWHTMLIQGYLHDKFFQKIRKQSESFGQGYRLRNGILYFIMDNQARLYVPDSADCNVHIKNGLLDKIHQSLGHASYSKTCPTLASHFY